MTELPNENITSPKSPDKGVSQMAIDEPKGTSYSDIVKNNIQKDTNYLIFCSVDPQAQDQPNTSNAIQLSTEDKERIYGPWRFSIIIKAVGKWLNHHYLRSKLAKIWKI